MHSSSLLVLALSAAGMVSAHGKISVVTGNAGGNGTALGIMGGSVPTFGPNSKTETDTTVFGGNPNNPMTDGLGKTTSSGKLKVADLAATMQQAGSTLPQVTADGAGSIDGTWSIVTSDGTANDAEGNMFAVIDPTGTGAFSQGVKLTATSSMVGNGRGNVVQRSVERVLRALGKRATNVGAQAAFSVKIPAGTTCSGSDATSGQSNFCLLKVANNNAAGPFGGTVAFQIAGAANSTKAAKTARDFQA